MTLEDRVHLHFTATDSRTTELWKTLGPGDEYTIPGSQSGGAGLYIVVCSTHTKAQNAGASTEYATVQLSTTSLADASAACPAGSTVTNPPAIKPSPPVSPPPPPSTPPPSPNAPEISPPPPGTPAVSPSPTSPPPEAASPPPASPSPGDLAGGVPAPAPPLGTLSTLALSNPTLSTTLAAAFPAGNAIDGDTGTLICSNAATSQDQYLS